MAAKEIRIQKKQEEEEEEKGGIEIGKWESALVRVIPEGEKLWKRERERLCVWFYKVGLGRIRRSWKTCVVL